MNKDLCRGFLLLAATTSGGLLVPTLSSAQNASARKDKENSDDQHQKGRVLTDMTLHLATAAALKSPNDRRNLREALHQFLRMYEPHEAREDTVLFPAFRKLVSKHEYDALGENFEKQENQLFGGDGFEKNVDAVARLERRIGIYDLEQFTHKV